MGECVKETKFILGNLHQYKELIEKTSDLNPPLQISEKMCTSVCFLKVKYLGYGPIMFVIHFINFFFNKQNTSCYYVE